MRKLFICLLLITGTIAKAQIYNNEWIDYTKTYYKFKIRNTGLYRISGTDLMNAGISIPAQNFQLWRNGVQVPLYTSISAGTFSASDYIEFWGEMNDGKPDRELYRNPDFQLNNKWSLETDTATYFLTNNSSATNLRLTNTPNPVAGTTLPTEPYFMYTLGRYFNNKINNGDAVNVGEYLYSSAYDRGEGYTSQDIDSISLLTGSHPDLHLYAAGPPSTLRLHACGNNFYQRRVGVKLNGAVIDSGIALNFFNYIKTSYPVANSILNSNVATIEIDNISTNRFDKLVVAQYELIYPREFHFGGASNFEFTIAASPAPKYLEIKGFAYGSAAPILYDVTNGKRYIGDISTAGTVKVVVEASATEHKFILVSSEAANRSIVTSFQSRTFTNYNVPLNQGNYLIITNALLLNGAGSTNPVEDYRLYRSSAAGGSFTAKTFLVDELTDQFAFGIKKSPLAIRNFLRFARATFAAPPKNVLLVGKGVHYVDGRSVDNLALPSTTDPNYQNVLTTKQNLDRLDFVPTFGWPASDVLLSSDPGSTIPKTPIGRLSVITADEVGVYLKKIKEYEAAQKVSSPLVSDKGWMKNVVHVIGASVPTLQQQLDYLMTNYKAIIADTLFGAKVTTFSKTSAESVQQINNNALDQLFAEGISMITYFGHSSTTTLEFNLNNPDQYNNPGKYPMFIALGCNAGNFYKFSTTRLSTKETLSEKFVLAPDRGTIGFVASSHFGIVDYLDKYATPMYQSIAYADYGKSIGEVMKSAVEHVIAVSSEDHPLSRATCEETILHGDPAVTMNPFPKPDYVIENPMIKISPNFISVADASFKVSATFLNIGRAVSQKIVVQAKQEYADRTTAIVFSDTIQGIRYADSVSFTVPIDPIKSRGANKLTITVDAGNTVDELYETNNSITKEFVIYEDVASPVHPYNLSIVTKQNVKLIASTANPFSASKTYMMEIDTTQLFNSPLKTSSTTTSGGGILEFTPGLTFSDSAAYYWRVSPVTANGVYNWSTASFIYLTNGGTGFNQSHIYQHKKSDLKRLTLDSSNKAWQYDYISNNISIRNGVFGTATNQEGDLTVSVNGDRFIRSACVGFSLIFNVFDPRNFKPAPNPNGAYGSAGVCQPSRLWNYEYSYMSAANRKKMMDFMDSIPNGSYVIVRNIMNLGQSGGFAPDWKGDTALFGQNNSLYHKLKAAGFATLDSFTSPRVFAFIYQKGNAGFKPVYNFSEGPYDLLTLSTDLTSVDTVGFITSPVFGPARQWKSLKWRGRSEEAPSTDLVYVDVIGIKRDGSEKTLFSQLTQAQQDVDISGIDVADYPYAKLRMRNQDSIHFTPYQLGYWRLNYEPVPEGAVAPNLYFNFKDTLDVGEPVELKIAFKNVSDYNFKDSLNVKVVLTDRNNVPHLIQEQRYKPLISGDTLRIQCPINSRRFVGNNTLYVEFNPDDDPVRHQLEQYHFNNYIFNNLFVKGDTLNPLLDVTFDNRHILNNDIVSSKPDIIVKLKDEAKWMLLDDTSLVKIQVLYPDGAMYAYRFDNDTLKFAPAQQAPNMDNTATINFNPYFSQDGNYELIVSGKDKSENRAGSIEYRVGFQVFNKPMISNMLNYPNPFTTSTAFVFTLTGTEVPQNIKIQILTVTGKIVREITKEELGPLRIGRNITEFKWDGTDQYGQKLGNGVYLYRVVTNMNGKSLDKYKDDRDDTDKYFNKGYGKMYLMR